MDTFAAPAGAGGVYAHAHGVSTGCVLPVASGEFPPMVNAAPSLSIITATLNARSVLPALIESLRQQTDRAFEWIVVDGASSDGTLSLIETSEDVVTRFTSGKDAGIYEALNKGLAMATGTYYLVVGADDVLRPEAVAQFRKVAADTGADLIAAAVEYKDVVLYPSAHFERRRGIHPLIPAHSVGCLIRKGLHDGFGMYSQRYRIASDTAFLLKAYLGGAKLAQTDMVMGRFGEQGISSTHTLLCLLEVYRVQLESGSPLWRESVTLLRKLRWYARRRLRQWRKGEP